MKIQSLNSLLVLGFITSSAAFAGAAPSSKQDDRHTLMKAFKDTYFKRPNRADIDFRLGGGQNSQLGFDSSNAQVQQSCLADEGEFLDIQRSVIFPWQKAWKEKKPADVMAFASKSLRFTDLVAAKRSAQKKMYGHISHLSWSGGDSELASESEVRAMMAEYLKEFREVEDFRIDIQLVKSNVGQRFSGLAMKEADLEGTYDLRGRAEDGTRMNDRGKIQLKVVKESAKSPWQLSRVGLSTGERVMTSEAAFVNHTAASGVDNIPSYLRLEAIRRGGFALAMGDFDGDNNQDMYVGAYGPGKLLKGDGKGGFKEVTNAGLASEDRVKSAIFADFDNNGTQDLLLVRFAGAYEDPNNLSKRNLGGELVYYSNLGGGKFASAKELYKNCSELANMSKADVMAAETAAIKSMNTQAGRDKVMKFVSRCTPFAMPATMADFNNDKLLDFYVGFPGVKDFTSITDATSVPKGVVMQGLFVNKGGDFAMRTVEAPRESMAQALYAHSALAADFDQDGDMDLLVVDDRGNLSPAYRNDGTGNFSQVNKEIGFMNEGYGMGLATADIDNDGKTDLMVSNVQTLAAQRIHASCYLNWGGEKHLSYNRRHLRVFKNSGTGRYEELNDENALASPGEGLAGVEFVDYNNDGLMDIYVANGLWSGTDDRQSLDHFFFAYSQGIVDKSQLDEQLASTVSPVMKALMEFKGDTYTGAKGKARPHLAGFQRNRLFRNLGGGKFLEVGFVEGVDSLADGYVIAKADVNSDGVQDLVLRNADPGSRDVKFSPVEIFINKNLEKNKVLRLSLIGTESNRDAIGAEVRVKAGDLNLVQQIQGSAGTAQSEKSVSFGLGKYAKADMVEIHWPSGIKQTLKDVPAGTHQISEQGKALKIGGL